MPRTTSSNDEAKVDLAKNERDGPELDVDMTRMVLGYLAHYGNAASAGAFLRTLQHMETPIGGEEDEESAEFLAFKTLDQRTQLRKLIEGGHIEEALSQLDRSFPHIFSSPETELLRFRLICQQFVEIVQRGTNNGSDSQALVFAECQLAPLAQSSSGLGTVEMMQEVVALLAYNDPLTSPVAALFNQSKRDELADAVNTAIISSSPSRSP